MAWTWLRSCYGFNMRVWVGGVETIYPARWFFCDPDAQWFPSPHGAEASPWLKDFEHNLEWGDDGTLKKLDRGINPGYAGQSFVGDSQWFVDGHLPIEVITQPPACLAPTCGPLPPFNPDPRCPIPPFIPAAFCCQNYAPVLWHIQADLATGGWSRFNGRWTLTHLSGLFWEVVIEDLYIAIYQLGDFDLECELGGEVGIPGARYRVPWSLDCFNPDVLIEAYFWNHFVPGSPPRILFLPNT
jgi:hypothetical protein